MTTYRKASIRELTRSTYELGGRFLEGLLHREADSDQWMVGSSPLDAWLARHAGQDVTLILFSMEDADQPLEARVCRTCGREYTGIECPHCREVRFRLRGR